MTRNQLTAVCLLLAAMGITGVHLLTAQEIPVRGSRATPQQIKNSLVEHPKLTATVPHSTGRTVQELTAIANELGKTGSVAHAERLRGVIKEIVRRAEVELADKKAEITKLNEEIEDLKWAISQ